MGTLTRQFRAVAAAMMFGAAQTACVELDKKRRDRNKGPRGEVRLSFGAKNCGWVRADPVDGTINFGLRRPCKCGSGKRYRRCCLAKDLAEAESKRAKMPEPVKTGRTLEQGAEAA